MASSRIFVRGLPPTISESDFKKHFATTGSITDTKLFPHRRIGYVGYEKAEEAEKAVKYFNKTFIRMSKLAVELARPVADSPAAQQPARRGRSDTATPAQMLPAQGTKELKRKRGSVNDKQDDPKLQEFLNVMQRRSEAQITQTMPVEEAPEALFSDESDEEIQTISKKAKQSGQDKSQTPAVPANDAVGVPEAIQIETGMDDARQSAESNDHVDATAPPSSDADWLRSRTNRLLDLGEDADGRTSRKDTSESQAKSASQQAVEIAPEDDVDSRVEESQTQAPTTTEASLSAVDSTIAKIRESKRLFLRNLSYKTTEDDLRETFSQFQSLVEVHVPIDSKSGSSRGLAYIMFDTADDAVEAWQKLDGTTLNGRLLHILPAAPKRETQLDDYTLSKLPLKKQQQIKKRREAASTTFNWNSLYMNADSVMSSVADRLSIDKSALLDPTSSDAAVKQAHAETHVIQETKAYFKSQGVNLDAFTKKKRGDRAILIKNFPYDSKAEELRSMFEQHGKLKRFLMPPTGTIAIVEFESAPEARTAFSSLAYRKVKTSVLFLEKAPADLFDSDATDVEPIEPFSSTTTQSKAKPTASDLLQQEETQNNTPTATLFVRNLNFSTTTDRLDEVFRPLDGFLSARVKTKTDHKKPGQVLSMGFGFLEFRTRQQAQNAQSAMDGYRLDGHELQIRASHKGQDAAEQRKQHDLAKKSADKRAKLVIKNLPFEATKKDIRSLFGAYGQLRSVRLPKKIGHATRGFAFAEFTTPKEAESARDALRNTHLLGRRLVIDYAAEDPDDAEEEIEKMQSKMGSQLNKVAVQNLMGDGRKKFNVSVPGSEES
ncbi:RNA-binding domain-containing protein [Myriangium duriaei CBS 260.36]|uniref:Multiple RNA-binding domain-containing protein 1 n=1 Tax=Myriangium duriaei CBS 260.36 TaxID=1168546 RepID=A0A9P4ME54_9PEZI|nr:RNA-binding domain-containing protein [Myriangium duriaei CBS 260.36]